MSFRVRHSGLPFNRPASPREKASSHASPPSSSSSSSSPGSPVATSTPAHPFRPKVTFVGDTQGTKGTSTDYGVDLSDTLGASSSDSPAPSGPRGWSRVKAHFGLTSLHANQEDASTRDASANRLRGLVQTMRKKTPGKRSKLPDLGSAKPPVEKSHSVKDLISKFSTAQQGPEKVSEHARAGYAAKIARFIGVAQSLNEDYGHLSHPDGVLFAQYRNAYLQCDQSHRAHQATSVFLTTLTLPSSLGEGLQEARDRFALLLAEGPGKKIFDSWKSELIDAADVYKSKVNSLVGDSPEINFLKAEVRYLIGEEGAPSVQGYMGYFIAHHHLHNELLKISPRAVLSPYLATAFEGHFEDLSQVPEAREALFTHKFLPFKEYMDDLEHVIGSFLDIGVTLDSFDQFKADLLSFKEALKDGYISLKDLNVQFLKLKGSAQTLCEDRYLTTTRIQRDLSEFGEQLDQSFSDSVETGTMAAFFDYALKLMFPITDSPVVSVSGDFKGLEEALRGAHSSQEKFKVLYAYIETQYEDQGSTFAKLLVKEDQFMLTQNHKDRILATLMHRDSHMYQVFWTVEPSQLPPPPAEDLPPAPPTTSGDDPIVPPPHKKPKAATWDGVVPNRVIDPVDADPTHNIGDFKWHPKRAKSRPPIPPFSPPPAVVHPPEDSDEPPPPPHEDLPPPPPVADLPLPPSAPPAVHSPSPSTVYSRGTLVFLLNLYMKLTVGVVGAAARSFLGNGAGGTVRSENGYSPFSLNTLKTTTNGDTVKRIDDSNQFRMSSAGITSTKVTETILYLGRPEEIEKEIQAQMKLLEEDREELEKKAQKDPHKSVDKQVPVAPKDPLPPSAPASRSASPAPQPSVVSQPLSAEHEGELKRVLEELDASLDIHLSEGESLQPPFRPISPGLQPTYDSGLGVSSIGSKGLPEPVSLVPDVPLPPAGVFSPHLSSSSKQKKREELSPVQTHDLSSQEFAPIDPSPAFSVSLPSSDPLEKYRDKAKLDEQFAELAKHQMQDDLSRYYRPSPPPEIPFYRYSNIECPEKTRVVSRSGMDYPANHIGSTHIACEAPRRENMADFWNMVWEQGSSVIVMVAKEFEAGREKSAKYWDFGGENPLVTTFGNGLTVELKIVIDSEGIVTRSFVLSKDEESRDVTQFQYTKWPDHGIPGGNDPKEAALEIINLNNKVRQHTAGLPGAPGPVIVHCSAGVGRTGTYLAVDAMQEHKKADPSFNDFSLEGKVASLREARGVSTVQTLPQYYLLAEAALLLQG
jgi:protein tyrosine phosphatase